MQLTLEERAMLEGNHGPATQRAMEIVVALGNIYGAESLVPVESVQVAGVSYKNLGEAGLDFLNQWAVDGARARVPTFLNPAGLDLLQWQDLGFSPEFAHKQQQVIDTFVRMGIEATCTCTPYLVGHVPSPNAHLAWAESSAVSFANSVLGARTNREGGPSALASAITGRTANYGLHLEENRKATLRVQIECIVDEISDWAALGHLVGKVARNRIPYFTGLTLPDSHWDHLKALGAAMAASGAVALYHIEGMTPEAQMNDMLASTYEDWTITELENAYEALNQEHSSKDIDIVWLGCPHASVEEIERLARFAKGRSFVPTVWITTSRQARERALEEGYVKSIEDAGGKVVADTCAVVAPISDRFHHMATLSGKGAHYIPSYHNIPTFFGTWEQLEHIMLTGKSPIEAITSGQAK
ncbi:MAG: aconitase X catalytic domain-containing protein [Chloroflexota bacterium]